jgi:tetratricopeptide (TPR) repeat protein
MQGTAQQAIAASLSGDWKTAVSLNNAIIEENNEDVSALNRLANALYCLGEIQTARAAADKVLLIDPSNTIAKKTLEKIEKGGGRKLSSLPQFASAADFIAPPGRSKIIELTRITAIATHLLSGESVVLKPHQHSIAVLNGQMETIGRLPDNISSIIERCLDRGDEYRACVKSISPNRVSVFFRINSPEKVF